MAGFVRCTARIALFNRSVFSKLLSKRLPCTQQVANISSKAWRELNGVQRPPPYDYRNTGYSLVQSWFDKTTKRFDDNSKVMTDTSLNVQFSIILKIK